MYYQISSSPHLRELFKMPFVFPKLLGGFIFSQQRFYTYPHLCLALCGPRSMTGEGARKDPFPNSAPPEQPASLSAPGAAGRNQNPPWSEDSWPWKMITVISGSVIREAKCLGEAEMAPPCPAASASASRTN